MSNLDVGAKSVKSWKFSTHHGAGEWLAERFTSLALIPLTAWGVIVAFKLSNGGGYPTVLAFLKNATNDALIGLLMIISVWHMYMGLKAVIDDYFQGGTRSFLLFLVFLLSAALVVATAGALWWVHKGA